MKVSALPLLIRYNAEKVQTVILPTQMALLQIPTYQARYNQNQLKRMQDQKTLGICVIITTLFALSQGLTMTHLQGPPPPVVYTTWDYINARVMVRDHCYHVLDGDLQKTNKLTDGTTFTWSPNKLHLGGGTCGEIDITFNLVDKAFTFVSSNPPNAPWPCGNSDHPELQGYIQRIAKANHLALDSNVIQFVTLGNPKVNNLAIADKPK